MLKLNNESADVFLTVASKQGKKFFEVFENCDGYLDEVIEMTIKKGDTYANDLVFIYSQNIEKSIDEIFKLFEAASRKSIRISSGQ